VYRRLAGLLTSGLLAVGFSTAGILANPGVALADSCSANFLIGPYVASDPYDLVQSSAQINCGAYGRGGDKVELQIIKYSTSTVVADSIVGPCGSGCDYHHINVVAQSAFCSSNTATWYYARWRDWYDDKFGWDVWHVGVNMSLSCHL